MSTTIHLIHLMRVVINSIREYGPNSWPGAHLTHATPSNPVGDGVGVGLVFPHPRSPERIPVPLLVRVLTSFRALTYPFAPFLHRMPVYARRLRVAVTRDWGWLCTRALVPYVYVLTRVRVREIESRTLIARIRILRAQAP